MAMPGCGVGVGYLLLKVERGLATPEGGKLVLWDIWGREEGG